MSGLAGTCDVRLKADTTYERESAVSAIGVAARRGYFAATGVATGLPASTM